MKEMDRFKKVLGYDWYIQGFSALPVFLNAGAWSGITMKEKLGYGYLGFLLCYAHGYGEMGYLQADFEKLWDIIRKKISEDSAYLERIKSQYESIFSVHDATFEEIDGLDLESLDEAELFSLLKRCAQAQVDSVGLAHMIEPVSMGLENEFKACLSRELADKKEYNQVFATLTTMNKASFMVQEEQDLRKIQDADNREKALDEHYRKYYWIQNSFGGPKKIALEVFAERLEALPQAPPLVDAAQQKKECIRAHHFSQGLERNVALLDFVAYWQDERKTNVLRTVHYFGMLLEVLASRSAIPLENLHYMGVQDVLALAGMDDLKSLQKKLEERTNGVYFYMEEDGERSVTGEDFLTLKGMQQAETEEKEKVDQIYGAIAQPGSAIGKVVICKGAHSVDRVREGDILVASMTRPEFMPAMRRAAAFVTDEGGITCHAAIIAREMKKPCIIGTKIATKVLKDGDMVEVRANHGFVRILEKA